MLKITDLFATPEFVADNKSFYDDYIEYRVHGYSPYLAFTRTFGSEYWANPQEGHRRTEAMEATDYYKTNFDKRLKNIKIDELWHTKMSIHELLSTVRGPMTKDSTKLAAIKELNVLVGITVVDENGKTKAGRTLADFYESEGESQPPKTQ